MCQEVSSKDQLIGLLNELAQEDPTTWENSDLSSFLEAMSAWLDDCDGFYQNQGSSVDSSKPTWELMAHALQAAKSYE